MSERAVPYIVLGQDLADYTWVACGAPFESRTAGSARRADADRLGATGGPT